jgi:hypothetical protein
MQAEPGFSRGGVTAPRGAATAGSLTFATAIAQVTLGAEAEPGHLFRASCPDAEPLVSVDGGTVVLGSHSTGDPGWRCRTLTVTLCPAIPWEIRFAGAATGVTADLGGLRLVALEVGGSAKHLEVTLPEPDREVAIRVAGDASDVTLYRPAGVATRIQAERGARYLALDDRYADAAAAREAWQTPGFDTAATRYDVTIAGLARAVTVDALRP